MAHIKRSKEKPPPASRPNGIAAHVERFLIFVSGAIVGALAVRWAPPSSKSEARAIEHLPVLQPALPASEFPQADKWSEIPAHEKSDANLPALGIVLVVLAIGAFIMHAALWWSNSRGPAAIDEATHWQVIAARGVEPQKEFPQLQLSPERDLQAFLAMEQQQLHGITPVNPSNAVARIPIDRAMEILAQRGAPNWKTGVQSRDAISPLELQQRRATEGQRDFK